MPHNLVGWQDGSGPNLYSGLVQMDTDLYHINPASTVAELSARSGVPDGTVTQLLGYYTAGDGGGGLVRRATGSSATVNNGTVFSATGGGRWERVLTGSAIPVEWFGATGDGTDRASATQAAINWMRDQGGGTILFGAKTYKWNSTVTTYRGVLLSGSNTVIDATGITTPAGIIQIQDPVPSLGAGWMKVIENFHFKGSNTMTSTGYRTNLYGLVFQTHEIRLENVFVSGCDKGTRFENNAYIITCQGCVFRWNNVGVSFDSSGFSNSGEKILFQNCGIGSCRHAIYNGGSIGGCELTFKSCSIDYNDLSILQDNVTDYAGTHGSVLTFDDCHFENTQTTSATDRMTNSGYVVIRGGEFFENETFNAFNYFAGNGWYTLDGGSLYRLPQDVYLASPTAKVKITGGQYPIGFGFPPFVNRQNSGLKNNGFETGTLAGWTTTVGTNAAASTTSPWLGTYSLRIASTDGTTGTTVVSDRAQLEQGLNDVELMVVAKNASTQAVTIFLRLYNQAGTQTDDVSVSLAAATASFTTKRIQITTPPPGGGSYDVRVEIPANGGATNYAYLDEFYVWRW